MEMYSTLIKNAHVSKPSYKVVSVYHVISIRKARLLKTNNNENLKFLVILNAMLILDNGLRILLSKLKFSVLLLFTFIGGGENFILAQIVDYSKIGKDFSDDMKEIAAQREAKKLQLYNITQEAIRDINSHVTSGYSLNINEVFTNLQSSLISEVKKDYGLLTSGQRDPDGYSGIIATKVNIFKVFFKTFDNVNSKIKSTYDQLYNSKRVVFASNLINVINIYSLKVAANFNYESTKVSKRYSSEPINQRITLLEKNVEGNYNQINLFDFETKINNYCTKIISIQESNINSLEDELKVDLAFKKIYQDQFGNCLLPETLIELRRSYSDGTKLELSIVNSSTEYGFNEKFSNREEMLTFLKELKVKFDPNIPRLGIVVDSIFQINYILEGSTAHTCGLKLKDKILAIDGVKIINENQLNLLGKTIGQKTVISILRNGKKININGLLSGYPNVIDSYSVTIAGQNGLLIAKTFTKEEYGDTSKYLIVSVVFPRNTLTNDLVVFMYVVLMPNDVLNKTPSQYLNIFKPLIRAVNESIFLK